MSSAVNCDHHLEVVIGYLIQSGTGSVTADLRHSPRPGRHPHVGDSGQSIIQPAALAALGDRAMAADRDRTWCWRIPT
jgi:hypothetical protein